MSTADERNDSGLVRPDGSLLGRREFVAGAGAGLVATAVGCDRVLAAFKAGKVTFQFEGAVLFAPNWTDNSVEIYMPQAESKDPPEPHYDSTPARRHFAYLAAYSKYTTGQQPVQPPVSLLGKSLVIEGGSGPGATKPPFSWLAPIDALAVGPQLIRDFDPGVHACKIRLTGGRFMHLTPPQGSGDWSFSRSLNPSAPHKKQLAYGLTWETNLSTVPVKDASGQLLFTMNGDDHPIVVVGHHPVLPPEWTMQHPYAGLGDVDQDFKWLYRVLTPASGTWEDAVQDPDGLPARLLPAPVMVTPPIVGSPNCFGGCFGC